MQTVTMKTIEIDKSNIDDMECNLDELEIHEFDPKEIARKIYDEVDVYGRPRIEDEEFGKFWSNVMARRMANAMKNVRWYMGSVASYPTKIKETMPEADDYFKTLPSIERFCYRKLATAACYALTDMGFKIMKDDYQLDPFRLDHEEVEYQKQLKQSRELKKEDTNDIT